MARKIVLTSGKGGVGKTTICANLGVALARLNKRVVLVDVDIGLNNLDVVTGIENKIVYDIVDAIEGKCRVKQALVQDVNYPNLYVMPSAHSYNKSQVTKENVKKVIDTLNDYFEVKGFGKETASVLREKISGVQAAVGFDKKGLLVVGKDKSADNFIGRVLKEIDPDVKYVDDAPEMKFDGVGLNIIA